MGKQQDRGVARDSETAVTEALPPGPSPWPSPAQRQRDRALKREAVLRTAARLFNEQGFHATSLDDVARGLNVTKPTIYHYFRSKDDVLFECCRLGLEMIEEAVA